MSEGSWGGKRPGSGRKRGSKQKVTAESIEKAGPGEMPLEYMLKVMRDRRADEKRRDAMAIAAAAYIHPKLSSITGSFTHAHEPVDLSDTDLAHIASAGSAGAITQADGSEEPDSLH